MAIAGRLSNIALIDDLVKSGLMVQNAYVGGAWISACDGDEVDVLNPADGQRIGSVPNLSIDEARTAVDAAYEAFAGWSNTLARERARMLRTWYELIMAERDDLALLLTLEQGKPIAEARGEIEYAASFIAWYAGEAERLGVESITPHLENREMRLIREPLGVAALITPWNFPAAMITRKAAAAMATGCTVVVKPAPETPLSALALAALAHEAEIPAGVLNVITGDAPKLAKMLCEDPRVRALSFTGSTRVGKLLLQQTVPTLKRVSLELGGHAPFIIFPDMDLETAVRDAMAAKFQTSGQDCLAANRIYVHEDIYDAFAARFSAAVANLSVGNGLSAGVEIGPLMHESAAAKCQEHIDDALSKGAKIICGGGSHALGGLFFQPTALVDVTEDMLIAHEETFGPVAALMRFSDEDDVVRRANNTPYGLAAYIQTKDGARARRLSAKLDFGMVAINCVKMTGGPVPFGGRKQSGQGREGGRMGIEAFTDFKYICTHTDV